MKRLDAKEQRPRLAFVFVYLFFCSSCFLPLGYAATATKAAVVTPDPIATKAAFDVLEQGGNAIDALVAAQAVLNVVSPQTSGFGGAGYLLFYDAGSKTIFFYDGGAKASLKTEPDLFLKTDGNPVPYAERMKSGKTVGVPGTLKLLYEIHARYGTVRKSFSALLEPAIALAENGSEISRPLSAAMEKHMGKIATSKYFREIFFKRGRFLKEGEDVIQKDLARFLRSLQKKGTQSFYEGDLAKAVVKTVSGEAGLLNITDMKGYAAAKREPLHGVYEGYDLFTAGPPSAGGVKLLTACNLLSEHKLERFFGQPEGVHLVHEAMKLSRSASELIGDPDFFDLPVVQLLSEKRSEKQAAKIRLDEVMRPAILNVPETGKDPASASILIVDKSGSVVAYSGTLGDAFGSGIMVQGYGFFLNNLLADFDTDPAEVRKTDAPNVPGPGQRPRSEFAPLIVFREGQPELILNSQDGRDSSAVVLNLLVQRVNFGIPCQGVIEVPRMLDAENVMIMEPPLYRQDTWRVQLELWGHKTKEKSPIGNAQMICFDHDSGKMVPKNDPRGSGEASMF